MASNNVLEEKKNLAIEQQQCFYELLPDRVRYLPNEHRYLKQNIGYAIFGPPVSSEEREQMINQERRSNCYYRSQNIDNIDTDIVDIVGYDEQATKIINKIYDRICECAYVKTNPQSIYVGIIYNVIFFPDENLESKKEEKSNKKKEKADKEEKKENNVQRPAIVPIPIFTIRLNSKRKFYIGKAANHIGHTKYTTIQSDYEIWYIDTNGRVYDTWTSYVTTNCLPECTMVLPKNGVYQPNPNYPIEEDYSTVWVEIMDSFACSTAAKVRKGVDYASTAAGIAGLSVGIASLFTPLAPVFAISGLIATGASGAWTMGRCSEELIDRSKHRESIYLFDREAFPHWLGLAGSLAGLGTIGGGILLSRVAASGGTINNFTKVAFNTMLGGNLVLNGVGVVYMSYSMIEKYMNEGTVSVTDALNLATHVMFFATSVVNVKFAGEIIQDSQGKVLKDYRSTLRNKRLRYKFNRVIRRAAQNNTCQITENAEVIRYIKHREQLVSSNQSSDGSSTSNSSSSDQTGRLMWTFDRDKIIVGSIMLLNPLEFVRSKMNSFASTEDFESNLSNIQEYDNDYNVNHLVRELANLLKQFYTQYCSNSNSRAEATDFISLLRHMRFLNIDEDHLKKIFAIVKELVLRFENTKELLIKAFTFVWNYCKANLRQWGIHSIHRVQSDSGSRILQKIITVISEAINTMLATLYEAFTLFLNES